jgi:hypothetical protein
MDNAGSLLELHSWLKDWSSHNITNHNPADFKYFSELIHHQHLLNNWHSEKSTVEMIQYLTNQLSKENIEKWKSNYELESAWNETRPPVLVRPNINYCFAGIHEWLCCVITNTPFILNASENQFQLIKFLSNKLIGFDHHFRDLFDIGTKNILKPEKFIIYSEKNSSVGQYFRNKKAIIIEDLPTIAILTGEETSEDLYNLGTDIFLNLGQSSACLRKVYIPKGFDIRLLIEAIEPFSYVYQNNKYANNYDYHQSVFLMERIEFLDNGFLIIKEDLSDNAPTGCLFYEYYENIDQLTEKISNTRLENIICRKNLPVKTVKPGHSHFPELWNYPNNIDIIKFLLY